MQSATAFGITDNAAWTSMPLEEGQYGSQKIFVCCAVTCTITIALFTNQINNDVRIWPSPCPLAHMLVQALA
jgi:hypothetical protein